ncbi:MAG TPA: pseudouridine-5'-phosphate glycosidase [Gemmatimonadaceae bacterium]|nr:pseudouridine-5'-phosphate glycosidase [Gemmatimonadaceae bacterium]
MTMRVTPDVAAALRGGTPVVALESSVFAQGLPVPANREGADRMMRAVRAAGAVPAVTAVTRGVASAGLETEELERFLRGGRVRKLSARDVPLAMAQGADGATTVAAAMLIAHGAGIEVLATGGIGGVHRAPAYDESADLLELARTPVLVVCSGAKAILDLPATAERLETLGVPVIGYRTDELPAFYARTSGIPLAARAESAAEVAAAWRMHRALLRRPQGMVVMQPVDASVALSAAAVRRAVRTAERRASSKKVKGAARTPWMLAAVDAATKGKARAANLALLEANAALAAAIARALVTMSGARDG